jgi:hypothetical protein
MNLFDDLGDNIKELQKILPAEPSEYFQFPYSLEAYCSSLSHSRLLIKKVGSGHIITRDTRLKSTLACFTCTAEEMLDYFQGEIKKLSSLNFINYSGAKKFYGKEFFVEKGYDLNSILSQFTGKHKYNIKREYNISNNKYKIATNLTQTEVLGVFNAWIEFAKKRHFMVFKGHYLQYIKNYFKSNDTGIKLFGLRNKNNELVSVCGWEERGGRAQITLMKLIELDYSFSTFFWIKSLETIFEMSSVDFVFCGSTADKLKERIGMKSKRSFKVVFS